MALLREYAWRNSEEAFATLVSRHIELVYSGALRHVGNHHQAEEITQAVFLILARKARSLGPGTVLAGWLFRTALLTAANYKRAEVRRTRREQEVFMQTDPTQTPGDPWQDVAPLLNDAIASLREADRNAILLRFFQGKDYSQVAAALGSSEPAAHMRISRALEKLRTLFAKRGVTLSGTALGSLIAANAVQAAPAGLAASVSAAAVHGTALTASTLTLVKGTLDLMAWTKTRIAVGTSLVALLAFQHHQNSVQAQHLATARAELHLKREAEATQQARLADLRQQSGTILSTRRELEKELARLQARRNALSNSGAAAGLALPSRTLLSAVLQDPAERASLRQYIVNNFRNRVAPLVKELNLSDQVTEQVLHIGGDWFMKDLDAVAAFTDGQIAAVAAVQAGDNAKSEAMDQLLALLGDAGFSKYEECEKSFPARSLVEQFEKQLGFYSIQEAQRQRLLDLIATQPLEIASALAGDLAVRDLVFPEALNQSLRQQIEANQQILQDAATFLDPDQLRALGLMQTNNLSSQRRNVLRMLRKI